MAGVTEYLGESEVEKVQATPLFRMTGEVVHGFGRGSKLLGFPTANLDPAAFKDVLKDVPRGVYCGWVSLDHGPVYPTVLSLGLNPQFDTKEETVEAYIMHEFTQDFYGSQMQLLLCGYMRASKGYPNMEVLMKAIKNDETVGKEVLLGRFADLKQDELFTKPKL